jgi:hypothetical protein
MSPIGTSLHLVRRGDLVALGVKRKSPEHRNSVVRDPQRHFDEVACRIAIAQFRETVL